MKVLLADSSPLVCERLKTILQNIEGLSIVATASTFHDTIEMIDRAKPDVIILDIQMKDGSGMNVVRRLKREDPAAIIIVMTNLTNSLNKKKYLSEGVDFFLDKSFDFDKIVEILNGLLVSVPSEKENVRDGFQGIETPLKYESQLE